MAKKKAAAPAAFVPADVQWHGASALETFLVPVASLTEDPNNARTHPDENMKAIADSLTAYGQTKPILIRNGIVLAGNGTLRAARIMGWPHLAAVPLDHLTDDQARAYAVMDNRSAELAQWDTKVLGDLFRTLPENLRALTGFSEVEWKPLLDPPAQTEKQKQPHPYTVSFSPEQWAVVAAAMGRARAMADGPSDATDGRMLELICADFIAGNGVDEGDSAEH